MLVLRLLVVLGLISIAVTLVIYFLTGDRRYLQFSWQILKFTMVLLLIVGGVMAMGRIILF
jgi:hypothetical protein